MKRLHITIDEELLAQIKPLAKEQNRSVSNMAVVLMTKGLEKDTVKAPQKPSKRFRRPTPTEVLGYFMGRVNDPTNEAKKFINHFNSNGWKVGGKAPMKDWQSAINSWIARSKDESNRNSTRQSKSDWQDQQARDYLETL